MLLPNPRLVIDNPAIVAQIQEKAASAGLAKVYPVGALTKALEGKQPANMHALHKSGCIAVSNVREGMASDETLLRCLEYAASLELSVFFYPEEPSLANGCAHDGFTASRLGLPSIPAVAETVLWPNNYYWLKKQACARILASYRVKARWN